jgi:PAS domain-containing protein
MSPSQPTLDYLHTIIDNITDLIILIGVGPDHTYPILYVNKAFVESFGTDDVLGIDIMASLGKEVAQPFYDRYDKVVSTKKPLEWSDTVDFLGTTKVLEAKLLPILNAVGDCIQIISITRDMTKK